MKYAIIVEPEALKDLENIYNYISGQDSKSKAATFISELSNSIKSLQEMPYRCRESYYIDDKDTRDFIYKKYTIVFKIINTTIHILTIFRQRDF
jgi:plasmid stabilization system protein ParE